MKHGYGRHGGHNDHDGAESIRRHFMRHFERQFHQNLERSFGGFGRGFGPGGARTRRGDVKYVVLELLAEGPRHGYDIIRGIEERHGVRPSAGSVYPTLQMLEDGGFVTSDQVEGKRIYTITDAGREMLANRTADSEEQIGRDGESRDVRDGAVDALKQLVIAAMTAKHSDDATVAKIRTILDRARKEIYGVLAADGE
jgi:DNA-binding PadR family transcriptional regulator